jgi:hypothetical protein
MPPMQIKPFMARTMVEDGHGVKPLFPPAESPLREADFPSWRWG